MSYLSNKQRSYATLKKQEIDLESAVENLLWSITPDKSKDQIADIKQNLRKNMLHLSIVRKELLSLLNQ